MTSTDPADRSMVRPRWRRPAVAIAAATLVALVIIALLIGLPSTPDTSIDPSSDRDAPTFEVPDLRDPERTIALTDHRGQPIVVNFWASWCVPCRREMPAFQAVHEQLGDRVTFIGINHQDGRDDALQLLADTGVTYPTGYDPNGDIAAAYGLRGMPTTVFITADGHIAATHTGEMTRRELRDAAAELLPSSEAS